MYEITSNKGKEVSNQGKNVNGGHRILGEDTMNQYRATWGEPGCILGSRGRHWAKRDVAPTIENWRSLLRI